MKLSNELSRAGLLAFLPVLLVQGRAVRRRVDRLPDADGATGQVGTAPADLRVVVVGDSVAAGVGVTHHRDSMAGRLAALLHERSGRTVRWDVVARSGADATGVARLVAGAPGLADADVVVVSVGVNDVKNLRSDHDFRAGLRRTLTGIVDAAPGARVFLLGLPPLVRLPALPRPLGDLLGGRARRVERISTEVVAEFGEVTRLAFTEGFLDAVATPFAGDGFHPSAELQGLFALTIAERIPTPDLMEPNR